MRKFCQTCGSEYTVSSISQLYCSDLCRQAQTPAKAAIPLVSPAKTKRRPKYTIDPEEEEEDPIDINEGSLMATLRNTSSQHVAPIAHEDIQSVLGSSPNKDYKKNPRTPVRDEYLKGIMDKRTFVIDN